VLQADGSWITSPDARTWGRRFTFQNQRLLYWPLLMSGDFDLLKPFFDHSWNVLPMRKAITRLYLLPARPAEWDVDCKLHLEGGTVLAGTVKDGKLVTWNFLPVARKANVVVCGPAPTRGSAGQ
jgi:hypothetical protein